MPGESARQVAAWSRTGGAVAAGGGVAIMLVFCTNPQGLSQEGACMATPTDCKFSDTHEWFRQDGDLVVMGITLYAANELTDVTYVELKPAGTTLSEGDSIGEVESVKTTSDVFTAVGGEIVEANEALTDDPGALNSDPYEAGWLVKIRPADTASLDNLMDQAAYDEKYPVD